MTAQVTPYLYFNGNCKEAMTFYQECLGGSLSLMSVAETPVAEQMPDKKDLIMHANLMREGALLLMASDDIMENAKAGGQIELALSCTSESEIHSFFNALSEGGNVSHPVSKEFWGALFGQFTDKFGMKWMLTYDENVTS